MHDGRNSRDQASRITCFGHLGAKRTDQVRPSTRRSEMLVACILDLASCNYGWHARARADKLCTDRSGRRAARTSALNARSPRTRQTIWRSRWTRFRSLRRPSSSPHARTQRHRQDHVVPGADRTLLGRRPRCLYRRPVLAGAHRSSTCVTSESCFSNRGSVSALTVRRNLQLQCDLDRLAAAERRARPE